MRKKVLFYSTRYLDSYRELLGRELTEVDFLICSKREEIEKVAGEVEIAVVDMSFPLDLFERMPKLEWIQLLVAGVENYVKNADKFKNVQVCRIVGVFGKYIAEYVFAYILFLNQKVERALKAQRERRWDPFPASLEFIHKKTMGIMGLGSIGTVVAERAKGMGMRVISWDTFGKDCVYVDRQYGGEGIHDFLKEADYVTLTLPHTPSTTNLVNADVFSSMKKTAYLINVCRGAVVDENALIDALKKGEIAGAVIDVMKQEPLPADSELWDCPNLILTPHMSGPSLPEDMVEEFKRNFRRYLEGDDLIGVIDFERGF